MQRTKIEATQQVPNQYRSPKVPINKVRGIHGDKVLDCGVDKISERELSFSTLCISFYGFPHVPGTKIYEHETTQVLYNCSKIECS